MSSIQGGVNKLVRNIVASKGKTDFEKVGIVFALRFIKSEFDQRHLS